MVRATAKSVRVATASGASSASSASSLRVELGAQPKRAADDEPSVSLGAQHLAAKTARQRAEEHLAALKNRIAKLAAEELKVEKRVAEARRRTNDIWVARERSAAASAAGTSQSKRDTAMESELSQQRQALQRSKLERQRAVARSKEAMERARMAEVEQVRRHKREAEKAVVAQRKAELERCVERKRAVQREQRAAQERKIREREQALVKSRRTREEQRRHDDEEVAESMALLAALAGEEQRLVRSLEGIRDQHVHAFEELGSSTLGLPSTKVPTGARPVSAVTAARGPGGSSQCGPRLLTS